MYRYYKNASTCYVYLKDASYEENDWLSSEWWRRGWTLQELVAASPVFFYDRNWKYFSSKHSAREAIAQCARIPEAVLERFRPHDYTAAQKMSWASCRETTRVEDMAYCMLGLFDINMPLLYGEGDNAFRRLQLEILQKDADESLFAWRSTLRNNGAVLALLLSFFKDCTDMRAIEDVVGDDGDENTYRRSPTRATPWGIEITTRATKLSSLCQGEKSVCGSDEQAREDSDPFHLMAITLTTSRDRVREIPCTLILIPCGLSGRYIRHKVLRMRSDAVWEMLREKYTVQRQAEAKLYLHYDSR